MSALVDLHLHTTHSDGSETPTRVVELARAAGVATLSLTDHDTISSLEEGRAAARRLGVELVTGVEASLVVQGIGIHLLVYGFDVPSPFAELLGELEQARRDRVPLMLERLADAGAPLDEAELRAEAGGELIGRLHVAQALRRRGHVRTTQEAFDRYIGQGGPAYVERPVPPANEVIACAHRSGGVTVLAHPGAIPADDVAKEHIFSELVAAGLDGVEVWHPAHGRERERTWLVRAERHGLIATGGSDFHGKPQPNVRVGRGRGRLRLSHEVVERIREQSALHRREVG